MKRLVATAAATLIMAGVSFAQERPAVFLEKCESGGSLGCNERFCVKVHTTGWDQFPQGVEDTPEVYVRFSRKIRDGNGESMERNRFKATLDRGRDHNETLWFMTDDGPLLLAYVDVSAYLQHAEPLEEDPHFDIATDRDRKLLFRMEGDTCTHYQGLLQPTPWAVFPW